MDSFKRLKQVALQQPSAHSMITWVREPHIDEELSDAEEDNSSENQTAQQEFVSYVQVDD